MYPSHMKTARCRGRIQLASKLFGKADLNNEKTDWNSEPCGFRAGFMPGTIPADAAGPCRSPVQLDTVPERSPATLSTPQNHAIAAERRGWSSGPARQQAVGRRVSVQMQMQRTSPATEKPGFIFRPNLAG